MSNELITNSLYWENCGVLPRFISMPIRYENGELIVKVKAAMFGKALHRAITIGHPKILPPKVLGTLLAGDVFSDNSLFPIGTRIVINPHAISDEGEQLTIYPGAMSQFVKISGPIERGVYCIPNNVQYDSAVYCELTACAIEAVSKVKDSSVIIIIGCGLMALLQLQIAKHYGIEKIICIYNHPERKSLIQKFGGIAVEYTDDVKLLRNKMPDLHDYAVIDSAGNSGSLKTLFELAGQNCKAVLFAGYPIGTVLPIDANTVHYNNLQIMGSYHFDEDIFGEALELLSQEIIDLNPLITGRFNWNNWCNILTAFEQTSNISNIVLFD